MYAERDDLLVDEESPEAPQSPYTAPKWMFERVLKELVNAYPESFNALIRRSFNPIGADPDLRIGLQDPHPSHAVRKMIGICLNRDFFTVTGLDWQS